VAETHLTTNVFLETMCIDPLDVDSPIERGALSMEDETPLLRRNPGEDEEIENEIPFTQVNQEHSKKTNKRPIATQESKQPVHVRPAIWSKSYPR